MGARSNSGLRGELARFGGVPYPQFQRTLPILGIGFAPVIVFLVFGCRSSKEDIRISQHACDGGLAQGLVKNVFSDDQSNIRDLFHR